LTKAGIHHEDKNITNKCHWGSSFVSGVTDLRKNSKHHRCVSGYINGTTENPTYEQVSSKKTGHYEAVKISYDDEKVTAKELTDYFWKTIDPTDSKGQFCDKGSPYLTGLFYQNEAQKKIFEQSLADIKLAPKNFTAPIVTPILAAEVFYDAEDYHQNYYSRNPIRYNYYRNGCGRDKRIKQLWGEVASKQYKK